MIGGALSNPYLVRETAFMLAIKASFVRLVATAVVTAGLAVPALAQNQNQAAQPPKLKDFEKKELQSLYLLLDSAITTQAPEGASIYTVDASKKAEGIARNGDAAGVKWYTDTLRANDGKTYVPFMLMFDPALFPSPNVGLGVRVVTKGTATLSAEKDGKTSYPWDDLNFAEVRPAAEPGSKMVQLSRAFQLAPGDYDVYLAVRPHSVEKTKEAPYKALVVKKTMTLPNFSTDLTTSSVLVLEKIEQVSAPLTPVEAREQPWVMGSMRFVPSLDKQFAKTENFGVYFQVYNETIQAGKPDVTIEYSFYRKQGGEEKYFNKTAPQNYNGQTLPPEWSADMGHLVSGGIEIPLGSFEPGDYRLEIKVTDNHGKKTITRDVAFSVTGA